MHEARGHLLGGARTTACAFRALATIDARDAVGRGMNDEEIVALQGHLAKQVEMVSRSATAEEMTRSAESITGGLTREERTAAAMLYVLRLLKERHRQVVADTERSAQSSRKRTRFEDTIPADDAYWEQRDEADREFRANMQATVDAFLSKQRVRWTAELLASTFALPDGTLVPWGDATVEQHEARRAMFLGNAQANLEGASRHEQAIRDLTTAGVETLRDLAAVAA